MRAGVSQGWSCLEKIAVPPHGYLTDASHGSRWACDRGYRATGGTYVAIAVPENGYLTNQAFGDPWACERGFLASADGCIMIDVPDNAYLVTTTAAQGGGATAGTASREASAWP